MKFFVKHIRDANGTDKQVIEDLLTLFPKRWAVGYYESSYYIHRGLSAPIKVSATVEKGCFTMESPNEEVTMSHLIANHHMVLSPRLIEFCKEFPKKETESHYEWFHQLEEFRGVLLPEYVEKLKTPISEDGVRKLCQLLPKYSSEKSFIRLGEGGMYSVYDVSTCKNTPIFSWDDSRFLPAEFIENVASLLGDTDTDRRDWIMLQGHHYVVE